MEIDISAPEHENFIQPRLDRPKLEAPWEALGRRAFNWAPFFTTYRATNWPQGFVSYKE